MIGRNMSGAAVQSGGLNQISMYDVESHVAEIYDRQEDKTDDVALIGSLIGGHRPLRILEPFCGTGRILIPLALDGHTVVGIDRAKVMLDRAKEKSLLLPANTRKRIALHKADILGSEWPRDFDLVILGGNCLYELATVEEQQRCIAAASRSLKPSGHLYLDNNHMEGSLAESWQKLDMDEKAFPTGRCEDGTQVQTERQRIWFDVAERLVKYRRRTTITFLDGRTRTREYLMQCHPPSSVEMRAWLEASGLVVRRMYGDRSGGPYEDASDRAIFWAEKAHGRASEEVRHGVDESDHTREGNTYRKVPQT